MTGELLADLEQWARLTGKLAAGRRYDTVRLRLSQVDRQLIRVEQLLIDHRDTS
jgi:hypothetical protein